MNRTSQQRLAEFENAALGYADQLFRVALRVVRDHTHSEHLRRLEPAIHIMSGEQ
jgi:hypothetical protein